MKKNKVVTYLLIAAVLVVWGLIIYKIIGAYSVGEEDTYTPPAIQKEKYDDYAVPKDTAKLVLNYRDPFGMAVKKDTARPKIQGTPRFIPVTKTGFNWDIVRYSGYIKNAGSKKLIAVMHIDGREAMMSEGEVIDQIRLVRNLKDSILISREGKKKYIRIKPAI
jgi:hypothetical protein